MRILFILGLCFAKLVSAQSEESTGTSAGTNGASVALQVRKDQADIQGIQSFGLHAWQESEFHILVPLFAPPDTSAKKLLESSGLILSQASGKSIPLLPTAPPSSSKGLVLPEGVSIHWYEATVDLSDRVAAAGFDTEVTVSFAYRQAGIQGRAPFLALRAEATPVHGAAPERRWSTQLLVYSGSKLVRVEGDGVDQTSFGQSAVVLVSEDTVAYIRL